MVKMTSILLPTPFSYCGLRSWNDKYPYQRQPGSQLPHRRPPQQYLFPNSTRTATYDHRLKRTGHPVRSAIHKLEIGRLVVGWVTTSEYLLLYVPLLFSFSFFSPIYFLEGGDDYNIYLLPFSATIASLIIPILFFFSPYLFIGGRWLRDLIPSLFYNSFTCYTWFINQTENSSISTLSTKEPSHTTIDSRELGIPSALPYINLRSVD